MFALIAAFARNRVIGKNGKIPWNISGEQTRFKTLTMNNVVIMGRVTFEEIYKKLKGPLPGRINIVISSRSFDSEKKDLYIVESFEKAVLLAQKEFPEKDVFFAGGEAVYKKAIPLVQKMFITQIDAEIPGDRYFPEVDFNHFAMVEEQLFSAEYPYACYVFEKTIECRI